MESSTRAHARALEFSVLLVHRAPRAWRNQRAIKFIGRGEAHHLAHHDGTLQITRVGEELTFKFEARNNFTRKTRELATRKALGARGFGKDRVNAILMRTVHVAGRADLSEEQWLTIALRYATESAC